MKPKRLFPGTSKVRRDQADRMLVKLRKKGHSRAQATAALVVHILEVTGRMMPSLGLRIRRLLAA